MSDSYSSALGSGIAALHRFMQRGEAAPQRTSSPDRRCGPSERSEGGPGIRAFAHYLVAHGVPGPALAWSAVAAVIELFGSVAIVLGLKTRYAAALLILFTIGAALIRPCLLDDPDAAQKAQQKIHFSKHFAIIGGLLFVFVRGAGPISIDRR